MIDNLISSDLVGCLDVDSRCGSDDVASLLADELDGVTSDAAPSSFLRLQELRMMNKKVRFDIETKLWRERCGYFVALVLPRQRKFQFSINQRSGFALYYTRGPLLSWTFAIRFTLTKITTKRIRGTRYATTHPTTPIPDTSICIASLPAPTELGNVAVFLSKSAHRPRHH